MKNFQAKKGYRRFLESKPVLVILALLVVSFAWGVISFAYKMRTSIVSRDLALNRLEELKAEKIKLSEEISKLETQAGVEASIRDRFGLVKEGEGLIVVVDDNSVVTEEEGSKDNWFVSLFKKWFK